MKRIAIGLVALTAIAGVAGVIYLYSSLGSIITRVITTVGSEMVQAKVELKGTDIDIENETGALRELVVGNPEGFKTESAFRMDKIQLVLDWETIDGEAVHLKEISIQSPEVTYELGANGSNIDAIQRNVEAFVKKYGGSSPPEEKDEGEKTAETKLIIDHIDITGGQVHVSTLLQDGQTTALPLPDIHLQDVGKKQNGATPGEVVQTIVDALKIAILKAVLSQDLNKLKDSAGKIIENTTEVVGDTLQKGAEDVTNAMNDIFGK